MQDGFFEEVLVHILQIRQVYMDDKFTTSTRQVEENLVCLLEIKLHNLNYYKLVQNVDCFFCYDGVRVDVGV